MCRSFEKGLPYKTLFPPGIQLHNPPSFLVEQARFARIKVVCVADYQIREIPITGAGPPKIFGKMNLLRCIFWLFLNKHLSTQVIRMKLKMEGYFSE